MRGQLSFNAPNPQSAASAYVEALLELLRKARPLELEVNGTSVFVTGGFFRLASRWNLLACVTSATIEVSPSNREVVVRYEIRLTQLIVACICASLLGIPIWLGTGDPTPAIVVPFLVWGWLFGMNWLLTRIRMVLTLQKVARAAQSEAVLPAKSAG